MIGQGKPVRSKDSDTSLKMRPLFRDSFTDLLDEYLRYKKMIDETPVGAYTGDRVLSEYQDERYRLVIDELNRRCDGRNV